MRSNFDEGYSIARQKIEKNFVEFVRNGSGYILDRVDIVSVEIADIFGWKFSSELPETVQNIYSFREEYRKLD